MYTVVNKLTLGKPVDDALLAKIDIDLSGLLRDQTGFISMQVVGVSPECAILIINFATEAAMKEISSEVAAPWFAENVRPYLGGPVDRVTGMVIASFSRT